MPRTKLQNGDDGRARVFIEGVCPSVDAGRHRVKRIVGDILTVGADLIADGHDCVAGRVRWKPPGNGGWHERDLEPVGPFGNDRYAAEIVLDRIGVWSFEVAGWVDAFATWARGLDRKFDAGLDVELELEEGSLLVTDASRRTGDERHDAEAMMLVAELLADRDRPQDERVAAALDPSFAARMGRYPDRRFERRSPRVYQVQVDPHRAGFSAWYEFFPRSAGAPGQHGSLRDAIGRLEYVASMGFDVVYLPPVHPIGRVNRKGPNNTLEAGPEDPGSPWAIGAKEGGHTAVHPELGTLEDFRAFVEAAKKLDLSVALDIAFQCAPDHPWVSEHPEWFKKRPDGSIQYAENPPKKYQDVYPFDFETENWPELWAALRDVFFFWIEQGVRIFRVDNPHTKPLPFWAYCIEEIKAVHPDVVFLAEAFTRPKLMYALAKLGFTQSYTYFTWRSTGPELRKYVEELTTRPVSEFFRPNFWPNTPDILPEELQWGGRAAFVSRLILAATLSGNYGIYGPAFELMEHRARPGSGEYIDNEKYQLRTWELKRPDSLRGVISRLNRIRRKHPALARTDNVTFHPTDNETLLCYSKRSDEDVILVVVNLDHHHRQSGWVHLDLKRLGIEDGDSFQVHDLMGDARFFWSGSRNYIELDPHAMPAHIFKLRRKLRREYDFDYFA